MKIDKELYKLQKEQFMESLAVNYGVNNIERLTLIVLLCNLTQSIRKSTPQTAVTDVITKIITDDCIATDEFLFRVSLWCEALLEGDQVDFPDFGFKDTKSKVEEIKRINNNVMPF